MSTGWLRRAFGLVVVLMLSGAGYAAGSAGLLAPQRAYAADDCQTFSQTGKQVCGRFLEYWQSNGGLAQQGLPITDAFQEKSDVNGNTYTVQYFERAVFELHPENQRPYDVLLSLLGNEKLKAKYPNGPGASPAPAPAPSTPPATGERTGRSAVVGITIHAIQDNVPGDNIFKPKAGYRWVALDVSVQNVSGKNLSYNALYGKLQTTDNREWDQPIGGKKPAFNYGTMQINQTIRGWFTFEVADGAVPMMFSYDPTFGSNPLSIPLR